MASPLRRTDAPWSSGTGRLTSRSGHDGEVSVIDSTRQDPGGIARLLRAHAPSILLIVLLVTSVSAVVTALQTPKYTSVVNVLVDSRVYLSGAPAQEPDMGSEKQVATSGAVAAITAKNLRTSVDFEKLRSGLSVSVPVDTNVLIISYSDPEPKTAQQRASAFAAGYLEYLKLRNQRVTKEALDRGKTAGTGLQSAEIITPATLPRSPSSPSWPVNLAVALVVGLSLGVGGAVLRDRLSGRLRGVHDFETRMAASVLAVVPMAHHPKQNAVGKLVMVSQPRSASAQAYRSLRARVLHMADSRGARTLVVTSSSGEEAKSAIAVNLAVALAQAGKEVVLVCGDLHQPRLHDIFGLDNSLGLSTVVTGAAKLEEVIRGTGVERLFLLTAGPVTAASVRPQATARFAQVLTQLRDYPDIVVVDLPPVLSPADSEVFAEFADMMLLVESLQDSTRDEIDAAMVELEHLRGKLIGGVLVTRARSRRNWRGRLRFRRVAAGTARSEVGESRHPWVSATGPNRS